jgi:pseudouridine-5'-phosphate glycosidase
VGEKGNCVVPTWLKTMPNLATGAQLPVVALESTVISHGLPYPDNLRTALRLEEIVRSEGAIPATVGIIGGEFVVGLDRGQIEHLATAKEVLKVSRRDLPVVVARRLDGATTVSTTAWAAHQAGIRVFATGGIGGVHRVGSRKPETASSTSSIQHSASSFLSADISADLPELAQTPVLVVCAGAKAILDLSATLEWLETHGLPVDVRADSAEEVAALYRAQRELGLPGGMLVTVPVPPEAELPRDQMDAAITQALEEAEMRGVSGRELTPFLLARVSTLTGKNSLRANLALLENNARVGARIAVAVAGS